MQSLHLVGFTDDRQGLVFSARQGGKPVTYLVELDQALVDAVLTHAESSPGRVQGARSAASGLSPREIQARLRAGATVTAIADEAGVSPTWVERFAPPVLAERENAVASARAAKLSAPRRGVSAAPLGEAVDAALVERGVGLDGADPDVSWSARQVAGTTWAVDVAFRQRGRLQRAEWRLDTSKRTLTAVNRLAGELGWVAGAAPEVPAAPPAPEATAPTGRPAGRRRAARRPAAPKLRAVGSAPPRSQAAASRPDAARAAELRAARAAKERAAREAERAAARRLAAAEREAARQALAAQKAAAKVAAAAEREAARTRAAAEKAAAKRAAAADREAARTLAAASRAAAAASSRPSRRRITAVASPPPAAAPSAAAAAPSAVAAVAAPGAGGATPPAAASRSARRTPSARVQAALAVAETRRSLEQGRPPKPRRQPAHAKRSDDDGSVPDAELVDVAARQRPLRAATRATQVAEPGA